eukprot:scaffold432_cov69-Cyclotella_meneghiniana.AAC.29
MKSIASTISILLLLFSNAVMATKNAPLRGVEASIEGAKHHEIENLNPELEEHLNLAEEEKESGVARNLDGAAGCNKDCGSGRYRFKSCSQQDNGKWKCQQKRTEWSGGNCNWSSTSTFYWICNKCSGLKSDGGARCCKNCDRHDA